VTDAPPTASAERMVCLSVRDADRQVYGVQGGRHGHVEAVMGAADEEMALHAGVLV